MLSCCQPGEAVRIVGFDPESDFILKHHLRLKNEKMGNNDVILGSNFDEDIIGNPYLILGREFYPKNQLNPTGSGIDNTIFMTLDTVRKISKDSVFKDTLWQKKDPADYISAIFVKLKDGIDPLDIQKYVKEEMKYAKVCTLKGISKSFTMGEKITPLRDVNLQVMAGDFIAIEGSSGTGKSTLLYLLGTLLKADSGEYLIEGKNPYSFTDSQLSELRAISRNKFDTGVNC